MGFAGSFGLTIGRLLSLHPIFPYSDTRQRYGVEQNLLVPYPGKGTGSVDIHAQHLDSRLPERGIAQSPIDYQH